MSRAGTEDAFRLVMLRATSDGIDMADVMGAFARAMSDVFPVDTASSPCSGMCCGVVLVRRAGCGHAASRMSSEGLDKALVAVRGRE